MRSPSQVRRRARGYTPRQGSTHGFLCASVPSILQNAAILTVIVALAGYSITFLSTHMLARRRDKLELVNKRLNEFYGPLYVLRRPATSLTGRCSRSRARRRASPFATKR